MIAYDLKDNKMSKEQPPALDGNGVVVNYIAPLDGSSDVYVAGNFQSAAGLPCPSVCVYQMDDQSWSRPGAELDGTANVLRWSNKTTLYAAGNLTINDKKAYVATYDAKKQNWDRFYLSDKIPGPVTSLIFSNQKGSEFWIAGTKGDSNGDPFIMYYNGASIKNIGKFDKKTTITDLRVVGTKNKEGKNTQALIALGSIQVPNFGVASAAVFDPDSGDLKPFLFATDADGKPAKINGFFSEKSWTFEPGRGGRSRGIIVLVSFCISLGCVFLIVAGGIIASTIRRKRQGYVSAPQGTDRKPDLGRVPPAYLLNDLNGSPEGPGGAPMI
ncbi:hypothetical protein KEM55_006168 [Ascosphaera atra]|nr:hypothetical protein KEM55_006168 [Ascosphaera atra]